MVCTYVRNQEPRYDYLLGAVCQQGWEQAHAKHTQQRQRRQQRFEMRHMGAAAAELGQDVLICAVDENWREEKWENK